MRMDRKSPLTRVVHDGRESCETGGAVALPVVHSAPFQFESTRELVEFLEEDSDRVQPEYGRMGNPTVRCVERRLAALEGGQEAQLFASGMAAITSVMLSCLSAGDHVILTSDCYKRTRDFAVDFLARFEVGTSVVEPFLDAIAEAVTGATRLIFTEVPTNPFLRVVDVEGLADLGRNNGIVTLVDSTFATPLNLRPLELGIDLVVHSCTKYLGGHHDLIAGVLTGSSRLLEPVGELIPTLGSICGPQTAFLLDRGLKTLALRLRHQNEAGLKLARWLEERPEVARVFYPGLPSHPDHRFARRFMDGWGGVVTFVLDADFGATCRFIDALRIPFLAPSLGGVESLVEPVVAMGYWEESAAERNRYGIEEGLVRLAVGVEAPDDLIDDLEGALERL